MNGARQQHLFENSVPVLGVQNFDRVLQRGQLLVDQ